MYCVKFIVAACMVAPILTNARAESHVSFCDNQKDRLRMFVCNDKDLGAQVAQLDQSIAGIQSHLDKTHSRDLEQSELEWFNVFLSSCATVGSNGLAEFSGSRTCLNQRLSEKRSALRRLKPSNDTYPKYQLSPLELEIASNFATNGSSMRYVFSRNSSAKAFSRVIRQLTQDEASAQEFERSFGPESPMTILDSRFATGADCSKHACNAELGAMMLDLYTGEIVIATFFPNEKLVIYEKECISPELKRSAEEYFQKPWELFGPYNFMYGINFTIKSTPCN